jgi:FdhD protein
LPDTKNFYCVTIYASAPAYRDRRRGVEMDVPAERAALASASVARVGGGARRAPQDDRVAVEAPVAFLYNCEAHAVMMASPRDLVDFGFGFSISEGIVADVNEVLSVGAAPKGRGMSLSIEIPEERAKALGSRKRNLEGRTGCGLCGIAEIGQALRPLERIVDTAAIEEAAIVRALAALPGQQTLNRDCGATHAAALASRDGRLLCVREDVGRHNALDKLIGAAARGRFDPTEGFIVLTSRCSMEMVQKTVTFGCPILVAVSAPTSLAIELAEAANLTVAAFARGDRFNLYTHAERVA